MKKNFCTLLLMAVALFSTTLVSCSSDEPELDPDKPGDKVVMGKYNVYFTSLSFSSWPDNQSGIVDQYAEYQKSIIDALPVDVDKLYKWSDIEAQKAKLQEAFDKVGDFEYELQACRNCTANSGYVNFTAKQEGDSKDEIDFGSKRVSYKLNIPSNTTCQLYIEIRSNEIDVPSAKEYNAKVRALFTDALKDVFSGEYGTYTSGKSVISANLYNANTDSVALHNRVKKICNDIKIPEVPEEIKEGAKISPIFQIGIQSHDPKATRPDRFVRLFSHKIEVK